MLYRNSVQGLYLRSAKVSFLLAGFLTVLTPLVSVHAETDRWSNVSDHQSFWGSKYQDPYRRDAYRPCPNRRHLDAVRRWNSIAIDASGLDHTPVRAGENRVFGEQVGPGRSSRAMAIVHIAMFDTITAVLGGYESYTDLERCRVPVSLDLAVSQAAHDTLVALYPSQAAALDAELQENLDDVPASDLKNASIALGQTAAETILAFRSQDGANQPEVRVNVDWITNPAPGHWRQDPVSRHPLALGAHWSECVPFVLETPSQFRVPPPPALNSPRYTAAYNEVKRLGGDGITTPTKRTLDQSRIGIFWAYDGTPSLCAPPRLYNQVAIQIADQLGTDPVSLARLLVLINVGMADAGIAIWESKYFYDVWRPVTAIRESDPGTGPTRLGDGNPWTIGDPAWTPLGAPASNLTGPNFTPPFPAYPSGHAGFGGTLFQILRRFYRTDAVKFRLVSDEFNGVTRGNDGKIRPLIPRTYQSFTQAEEENGQSRIYLGIHWSFDKTEGIIQGRKIGNYVFDNCFRTLRH